MNNYIIHAGDGNIIVVLFFFQCKKVSHTNKGMFTLVDKGCDHCFPNSLIGW